MKVWIVIPAYNEEKTIGGVIDSLRAEGWNNIIVVNDGSTDRTGEIAGSKGAVVVTHTRNTGLGGALRSGLAKALELGADVAVTFDADGQHDAGDVRRLVAAAREADLVIGRRIMIGVPLNKRLGNFILNVITRLLGGPYTDSQSGLRALSRRALERIRITCNRYAVSSEILIRARRAGLRVVDVPAVCRFSSYSKAKGTTIASGIRIAVVLGRMRASL